MLCASRERYNERRAINMIELVYNLAGYTLSSRWWRRWDGIPVAKGTISFIPTFNIWLHSAHESLPLAQGRPLFRRTIDATKVAEYWTVPLHIAREGRKAWRPTVKWENGRTLVLLFNFGLRRSPPLFPRRYLGRVKRSDIFDRHTISSYLSSKLF